MTQDVYEDLLETIGRTPMVRLRRVVQGPHKFYAKLEAFNPGQNIKDRAALSIIEGAERRGELKPGATIIEATSGNTGLGLAMIAAVRGYQTILVMPDKVSEEKRAILRAYGARVVVCPTAVEPEDPRSYYCVSRKLVEITPNSFYANQYFNEDNLLAHYDVTGP
ncbi:MAG: pyridoxal-phosphate dependent enzyme, partial [Chromatiales bacterium]|nr:pyridoxal-phosphate dependent enzyme [Chromatiales bacterium]